MALNLQLILTLLHFERFYNKALSALVDQRSVEMSAMVCNLKRHPDGLIKQSALILIDGTQLTKTPHPVYWRWRFNSSQSVKRHHIHSC
jgi:hypothetical protein